MKLTDIHNWSTERISQRVLYILIGVCAFVFGMFYLIGYDRPFEEDANFKDPLFTDGVLVLMFILVAAALGVSVWSIYRGLRVRGKAGRQDNNIPVKKISYIVGLGTFAITILTFIVGSSSAMVINGKQYADAFWLKTADMFIYSGLILILVAVLVVGFGTTRYYRKDKH